MTVVLAVFFVTTFAYGGEGPGKQKGELQVAGADLVLKELSEILEERDDVSVGELRISDVREVLAASSVRMQEIAHVQKTRAQSWAWPGAGHFANDDNGRGAFYTAANVVVMTGTVLGVYFLLPDEVQFDNLNYLDDSFGEIEEAWKGQSLSDYAPSIGVFIGGVATRVLLGYFAAESAAALAQERIDSGRVTFEPFGAADGFGLQATWWH
jgi:hypothetical protein